MEKILNLTAPEVHTLEQVLKGNMEPPSIKPFLLRLHSVFLDNGKGEVAVTEPEAWLIHDTVSFDHRVGPESTGITIRRKLALLLLEWDTEETTTTVAGDEDKCWDSSKKENLMEVLNGTGDQGPDENTNKD